MLSGEIVLKNNHYYDEIQLTQKETGGATGRTPLLTPNHSPKTCVGPEALPQIEENVG